ncbi:L,D-transpeptidase family protein [Asticcacaulis sp. EMRT-3]|uniref:L,D-transpeptidase family protein n=1 Tax=Asticcacaulis sp. EMRT-3 TaxID=3040349 RepID=UPI0024AF42CD|nr:L,D-transpeptidase family protein [Asticcacaulis sp. EMRT-3]MDI7775802.1 L,D-transpeptidase family protein [Asticcacaulis sp. EMRT-3]
MVKMFTARADGTFFSDQHKVRCALGKGGVRPANEKREGDGASPAGIWPIRHVFYRPDRLAAPETQLKLIPLTPDDGWCDDSKAAQYNRHVRLPFAASHETLWRDDHLYDVIVVLGHNDDPPVPGMGSAIFAHIAKPDYSGTEGCVALALPDMLALLRVAEPGDAIEIVTGRGVDWPQTP